MIRRKFILLNLDCKKKKRFFFFLVSIKKKKTKSPIPSVHQISLISLRTMSLRSTCMVVPMRLPTLSVKLVRRPGSLRCLWFSPVPQEHLGSDRSGRCPFRVRVTTCSTHGSVSLSPRLSRPQPLLLPSCPMVAASRPTCPGRPTLRTT